MKCYQIEKSTESKEIMSDKYGVVRKGKRKCITKKRKAEVLMRRFQWVSKTVNEQSSVIGAKNNMVTDLLSMRDNTKLFLEHVHNLRQSTNHHYHLISPPFPLLFHPLKLMITQEVRLLPLQSCFRLLLLLFLLPKSGQRETASKDTGRVDRGRGKRRGEKKHHVIISLCRGFKSLQQNAAVWAEMKNKHRVNTVLTTNVDFVNRAQANAVM